LGARLEKVGASEWAGPCPLCGGEDRFSVNVQKKLFNCRSSTTGDGSPIDIVIHCTGYSLIQTAEAITGELRPDQSRNETEDEREARLGAHRRFIVAAREREEEQRRSLEEKHCRDERTIEELLKRAVDLDDTRAKLAKRIWSRRAEERSAGCLARAHRGRRPAIAPPTVPGKPDKLEVPLGARQALGTARSRRPMVRQGLRMHRPRPPRERAPQMDANWELA
jgi:hypothetical protein